MGTVLDSIQGICIVACSGNIVFSDVLSGFSTLNTQIARPVYLTALIQSCKCINGQSDLKISILLQKYGHDANDNINTNMEPILERLIRSVKILKLQIQLFYCTVLNLWTLISVSNFIYLEPCISEP